jgi:hypothetical protein
MIPELCSQGNNGFWQSGTLRNSLNFISFWSGNKLLTGQMMSLDPADEAKMNSENGTNFKARSTYLVYH